MSDAPTSTAASGCPCAHADHLCLPCAGAPRPGAMAAATSQETTRLTAGTQQIMAVADITGSSPPVPSQHFCFLLPLLHPLFPGFSSSLSLSGCPLADKSLRSLMAAHAPELKYVCSIPLRPPRAPPPSANASFCSAAAAAAVLPVFLLSDFSHFHLSSKSNCGDFSRKKENLAHFC